MKKTLSFITTLAMVAMSLMSCASTGGLTSMNTVQLPETALTAANKILNYEKNGDYLYSFRAVNYGNAECEVKIYDDKYMKITYPQTGSSFYYYYNFTGDYLEHSERKGIFGYAVEINRNKVEEILFRNRFFGGYKFTSQYDQIMHDKRYSEGYITWNEYPEARMPDINYFLEFFQFTDKKLMSKTDEVGNKKDLAAKFYYTLSDKTGRNVTWKVKDETTTNATTETTN